MKVKQEEVKTSSNPLVIGAGSGVVLGAFFGPFGALVGTVAGAGIGFWIDQDGHNRGISFSANKRKKKHKKRPVHRISD